MKEMAESAIKQAVRAYFTDVWAYVKADLISTSYLLVLIGGTICIILYVAGWEKGMKYLGIMLVAHILIRAILG